MQVIHNSPRCLIEEVAPGPTLAKLLAETDGSDGKASVDPRREAALRTLTAFHRTALKAFVDDGLIHSDIHLGNISVDDGRAARSANALTPGSTDVQQSSSDPESQQLSFVLFDVGQFVRVGPADTKALVWALGWISTPHRRGTLRSVAIKHLVATSSLSLVSLHYLRFRSIATVTVQNNGVRDDTFPERFHFGCGRPLQPRLPRVRKVDCRVSGRWMSL